MAPCQLRYQQKNLDHEIETILITCFNSLGLSYQQKNLDHEIETKVIASIKETGDVVTNRRISTTRLKPWHSSG